MLNRLCRHKYRNHFLVYAVFLLIGLILRIKLSPYLTFELDLNTFRAWSNALNEHGLGKFYDAVWSDYMPGYMYVLLALNKIQTAFPALPYLILFKLPANLADLVNALIIFNIAKRYMDIRTSVFCSVIYYFNIALIANSTFWGQIESFHLLPVLLAIDLSLGGHLYVALIFASISAMIKPQSFVVVPFIFIFSEIASIDRYRSGIPYKNLISRLIISILIVLLTVILINLPFTGDKYSSRGSVSVFINTFLFIKERFLASYNQYQYTSVNAFNFWALTTGMWVSDQQKFGISYQKWGTLLFAVSSLIITAKCLYSVFIKQVKDFFSNSYLSNLSDYREYCFKAVYCIILIFFLLFFFSTRAHERHFYTAVALMPLIAFQNPIYMISYITASVIYLLNLFYSYLYLYPFGGLSTSTFTPYINPIVIIELIVLSLLFISYLKCKPVLDKSLKRYWILFDGYLKSTIAHYRITAKQTSSLKINFRLKSLETAVLVIFILSLVIKLYGINTPERYYFDEIYYAFTANEMAEWKEGGWKYVKGAPEGMAYEWSHPPLGKEITAVGIMLFGNNPVGWRIFQALFGAAGTIIIYFLATGLFRNKLAGLFTSILYSFDSMIFVLSRIAMVDIFLTTFLLLAFLFLVRFFNYRNIKMFIASGIFTGCAISVKWNGVFGLLFIFGMSFIFLTYENHRIKIPWGKNIIHANPIYILFACIVVIPLLIYVLTYIPFFIMGNSFGDFLTLQKSMYFYHKDLDATHPYSSIWWQWPLMLEPVFIYLNSMGDKSAFIYAMGNPVIWWSGSLATIAGCMISIFRRNYGLLLAVLGVFVFWVPWIISPRSLTFIYHFFPSIMFMLLILGYFSSCLWDKSRLFKYVVCIYLFITVITFFYFYPITAGLQISNNEIDSYMWIKNWR